MAYYPDVIPGTPISFSAGRETAINRLLNQADSFKTGVIHAKSQNVVRVQVWNSTQTAFAAGQAVQINVSGSLCGNAFPAVNFASVDAPWGVCANGIAPNAIGDLILSGPASVTISGSTGGYAKPVSGGTFTQGTEGLKILHISGTTAIVLLGDYHTPSGGGGTAAVYPDLSNPIEDIEFDVPHAAYTFPVWLIGNIGVETSSVGNDIGFSVIVNGYETSVYQWTSSTPPPNEAFLVPFSFLVPPNNPFEISTLVSGSTTDLRGSVTAYKTC